MSRPRLIGDLGGASPGRTVVCVGGIHGSEPAGMLAAERFVAAMEALAVPVAGRFVAVRGNLAAIDRGIRYVDRDLNRMWDEPTLASAESGTHPEIVELDEMHELKAVIDEAAASADGPLCVLDLHTTSSHSRPFVWLIPSIGDRALLPAYGLPIVHDRLGKINGTLAQYVAAQGHEVAVVEGGQHDEAAAVDHHEAVLWLTVVRLGLVAEADVAHHHAEAVALLHGAGPSVAMLHEVVHHHGVVDGDGFVMRPGYDSFQAVRTGEHLADDATGPILAPGDGRILMPLYKPPCDDGFMIVRECDDWPVADAG